MNLNYIVPPLIILIMVGAFTQVYYNDIIDFSSDYTQNQTLIANQTLNGTEQELELENAEYQISFDMTVGLILAIVGAIALGLIGLNVLGSGLSDFSVKIIWNGIVWYGLWAVISVFGYNGLASIPYFGAFLWFMLTLFYTVGVFAGMGGSQ